MIEHELLMASLCLNGILALWVIVEMWFYHRMARLCERLIRDSMDKGDFDQ